MIELIREFVREIFVYLLVDSMVSQLTSHTKFYPYIRFFMGLFLVLLLAAPVFSILQQSEDFSLNCIFEWNQWERQERQLEKRAELLMDSAQGVWEKQYEAGVEEIICGWAKEYSLEPETIQLSMDENLKPKRLRIKCQGSKKEKEQFQKLLAQRLELAPEKIRLVP